VFIHPILLISLFAPSFWSFPFLHSNHLINPHRSRMFEDSSNLPNSMRNVSLLNDRINHFSTVRAFIWLPFGFANTPATFPIFVNAISPEPVLESMRVQIWKFSLGSRDLFVNKCGLLVPNAAVSGSGGHQRYCRSWIWGRGRIEIAFSRISFHPK
jgi:hypothetical protein